MLRDVGDRGIIGHLIPEGFVDANVSLARRQTNMNHGLRPGGSRAGLYADSLEISFCVNNLRLGRQEGGPT
jgi:hypothetical protein